MALSSRVANGNPAQNTRRTNGWATQPSPFFKGETISDSIKIRGTVALASKWQHGGYVQPRPAAHPSHDGGPTVVNSTLHFLLDVFGIWEEMVGRNDAPKSRATLPEVVP